MTPLGWVGAVGMLATALVYLANQTGAQWRREKERSEAAAAREYAKELEKRLWLRPAPRPRVDDGLVTYDAVAKWLPEPIIRTIERTRP